MCVCVCVCVCVCIYIYNVPYILYDVSQHKLQVTLKYYKCYPLRQCHLYSLDKESKQ